MFKSIIYSMTAVSMVLSPLSASAFTKRWRAKRESITKQKLEMFKRNPKAFMLGTDVPRNGRQSLRPKQPKWDYRTGKKLPVSKRTLETWSPSEINSLKFVEDKDKQKSSQYVRKDGQVVQLGQVINGRSLIKGNDNPQYLVDNDRNMVRNIRQMDSHRSASLKTQPWSDDYWAIYTGVLGKRYADNRFPGDSDWKKNADWASSNSADQMMSLDPSYVNRLSPSEKYDLIAGTGGSLTRSMWNQGAGYYRNNGKVETWMGICHGWAPAAYMLPRPVKAITVPTPNGTPVTFYPSDIKALGSYAYATNGFATRFIGGRCNTKSPRTDSVGRIIDQDCFDNNPGTFHTAVVNQIGIVGRSLVLDATYDYEVWNQPILKYDYGYFNPQTGEPVDTLEQARVHVNSFTNDKFKSHREGGYTYVVGVSMNLAYMVETHPTAATTDSPSKDAINVVNYLYDLELDSNGNIVGGEWYSNVHPDFLWTPEPGAKADSPFDAAAIGNWDGNSPIGRIWRFAATRAARTGQGKVLNKIVEALFRRASQR